MTARILTQERLKEVLNYNPDTGIFTRKISLRGHAKAGDIAGTEMPVGYMQIGIDGCLYRSHRLAWLFVYGDFPADQIDHINHVRNDNRLKNLRSVSNLENHRNQSVSKNNTSGVTGVHWDERDKKWQARIRFNGKKQHIGSFNCLTYAAIARKKAEVDYGFHVNHGGGAITI